MKEESERYSNHQIPAQGPVIPAAPGHRGPGARVARGGPRPDPVQQQRHRHAGGEGGGGAT